MNSRFRRNVSSTLGKGLSQVLGSVARINLADVESCQQYVSSL